MVESVGGLAVGLAVAPGIAGACGSADRVALPGGVGQNLAEDGAALGKVSDRPVGLVEAGYRGFAAGSGEGPGLTAHNMGLGLVGHNLLVPAVHMTPSEDHKACHSCFQVCVLAFPQDIAVDLEGHSPVQDILAPVVDLMEAPAGTADCMDSLLHMVDP